MDFFTPRSKNSPVWLSLFFATILALLPFNRSMAGLEWNQLNKAMETKTQLFGDHAWQPMYGQKSSVYVKDFEWVYPQGYWRLISNKVVPIPGVQQPIHKNVKKGTPVSFVFFANPDYRKDVSMRFSLQSAKAPHTVLWTKVVKIDFADSGWKMHYYKISFPCPEIKADQAIFTATLEPPVLHCEFGSCWFYVVGGKDPLEETVVIQPDNGHKMAEKALQESEIAKRIDRQRKGKLLITVQDQNGKPIPDVLVKIKQTRQDFTFGCIFKPSQLADPQFQQGKFSKPIFGLFNTALLELEWAALEQTKGAIDFTEVDQSLELLNKNNQSVIAAFWSPGESPPKWLASAKAPSGSAIRSYVSAAVSHLSKKVSGFQFSLDQHGVIRQWIDQTTIRLAAEKLLVWSHVAGAEAKTNLLIRVDNAENLKRVFDMMSSDGSAPTGLSLSLPIFLPQWKATDDWMILQSLKSLNTDVYFLGWIDPKLKSAAVNEAAVATLKRRYLAAFSDPTVKAIIFPNPLEVPVLFTSTGATTPLYKELYALVHDEWRSNHEGRTGANGKFTNRVFFGDYELLATDQNGHNVKSEITFLPKDGMKVVVLTIKN